MLVRRTLSDSPLMPWVVRRGNSGVFCQDVGYRHRRGRLLEAPTTRSCRAGPVIRQTRLRVLRAPAHLGRAAVTATRRRTHYPAGTANRRRYDNLMVIRLDGDGCAHSFTNWWVTSDADEDWGRRAFASGASAGSGSGSSRVGRAVALNRPRVIV